MIIAFFDFDGTITKKDSFLDFVIFSHGKQKMIKGVLLHLIKVIGYKLGWISGHRIKEMLLTYFYEGYDYLEFKTVGNQYVRAKLPGNIRSKALEKIVWHKKQGHRVIVVTASLEEWVQPWCDELELELIATKIEVVQGKLTGRLLGKNCIGVEKVHRIREKIDISKLTYSYAYGNSRGDRELLAIADEKKYKVF